MASAVPSMAKDDAALVAEGTIGGELHVNCENALGLVRAQFRNLFASTVFGTTSYRWHSMRAARPYAVRERARPLRLHSHRSRPLLFLGRTAESLERRRSKL